jgi:hypothetical protein
VSEIAVNCISSHVWSPQWTSTDGFGFDLLEEEKDVEMTVRNRDRFTASCETARSRVELKRTEETLHGLTKRASRTSRTWP